MKHNLLISFLLLFYTPLFSQNVLVPGKLLNDKDNFIPEGTVSYMSVVREDSFDPIKWCLYFDVKCKEFIAVSYNDSTNVHLRYHCKVQEETEIAISDLFFAVVASSSYLAKIMIEDGFIYEIEIEDGIIYDIEFRGYKAYTHNYGGNIVFTDTLDKIIEYTRQGNGHKIDEMLPTIQSLTTKYRGYCSIPN